jgi:hypothetical protein
MKSQHRHPDKKLGFHPSLRAHHVRKHLRFKISTRKKKHAQKKADGMG